MEGTSTRGGLDIRHRLGRLVVVALLCIAVAEFPAILFSSALAKQNRGLRGFSKSRCSVKSSSVQESICQTCFDVRGL